MPDDMVAGSVSGIGDRNPMRFLMVAWLITVVALLGSVWSAFDSYQQYTTTAQHTFQAQELRGRIIHLDEVLTMSARMAVTTGDQKWERRYRQFEGKLDAAIQSAAALVPDTGSTEQTNAANVALIGMEDRAFELVRLGKLAAARAILFGEEYARQKAVYAEGMTILGGELAVSADMALQVQRKRMLVQLFSILVVIVILVIGWFVVIRLLHQWRNELAQSNQRLVNLNRDLDRKVIDRTAALERATEVANESNKAKSNFLANMSHELRTPMNAILGYSEMLMEEAEDLEQEDFIPDLKKINQAGTHLLALINDVLDLSKIEAGKIELFAENIDIGGLVDEVVGTAHPLMEKNNNQFNLEPDEHLGSARQDSTKLRQSLFNLLSNAAKFTHDGTVTLRANRSESNGEDWLTFMVSDTGIGIPEDKLGYVFEEFSQADESTTRDYGGTGLGLTISRRFCQMMGGDITVRSVPGEGSAFTIRIPAFAPSEAVPGTPTKAVPQKTEAELKAMVNATPGGTILVIDDDPGAREIIEHFLKKDGFKVTTAASGEEGLRIAHRIKPAAITLDVIMPDMDGWSVLRALKADPDIRDIPVVMVTMMDDKTKGYSLGATDYLTKPVNRDQLLKTLGRYHCADEVCTVLVVEDDEKTRDIMTRTMEKEDWDVMEAGNGREALEQMTQIKPDLILLDLMMPVMDGFDFLLTMRGNAAWKDIPVIVLTAKDLTEEDRRILSGRVEQVVEKGAYSQQQLAALVRDVVAKTESEPDSSKFM